MIDMKPMVDALLKGAPTAAYVALIGIIWQIFYAVVKDYLARNESKERQRLELLRFRHQRNLERQKFEYDKLKWREVLALELAKRHLDARLEAYPPLWEVVRSVSNHAARNAHLTTEKCKALAGQVETWRYTKGGLLAEETTRDAALALQSALWQYDTSDEGFRKVRQARRLVRSALRADMGLGANSDGQDIFDATAARQRIARELTELQPHLNLDREARG